MVVMLTNWKCVEQAKYDAQWGRDLINNEGRDGMKAALIIKEGME